MFLDFVIMGFACWRISNMVVGEEGPWRIFQRIRDRVGVGEPKDGAAYSDEEWLKKAFECVWCMSVWISIGWAAFYIAAPWLAMVFALPFAISCLAIIIHEYMSQLSH